MKQFDRQRIANALANAEKVLATECGTERAVLAEVLRRVVVSQRAGFGGKVTLSQREREVITRLAAKGSTTTRERVAIANLLGV